MDDLFPLSDWGKLEETSTQLPQDLDHKSWFCGSLLCMLPCIWMSELLQIKAKTRHTPANGFIKPGVLKLCPFKLFLILNILLIPEHLHILWVNIIAILIQLLWGCTCHCPSVHWLVINQWVTGRALSLTTSCHRYSGVDRYKDSLLKHRNQQIRTDYSTAPVVHHFRLQSVYSDLPAVVES